MKAYELNSVSLSNGDTLEVGNKILATEFIPLDEEHSIEEGEIFEVVSLEYSMGKFTVHTDREGLDMSALGDGTQSGIDGLLSSGRCRIISLREDPIQL